jgi:hypothetical protein
VSGAYQPETPAAADVDAAGQGGASDTGFATL